MLGNYKEILFYLIKILFENWCGFLFINYKVYLMLILLFWLNIWMFCTLSEKEDFSLAFIKCSNWLNWTFWDQFCTSIIINIVWILFFSRWDCLKDSWPLVSQFKPRVNAWAIYILHNNAMLSFCVFGDWEHDWNKYGHDLLQVTRIIITEKMCILRGNQILMCQILLNFDSCMFVLKCTSHLIM